MSSSKSSVLGSPSTKKDDDSGNDEQKPTTENPSGRPSSEIQRRFQRGGARPDSPNSSSTPAAPTQKEEKKIPNHFSPSKSTADNTGKHSKSQSNHHDDNTDKHSSKKVAIGRKKDESGTEKKLSNANHDHEAPPTKIPDSTQSLCGRKGSSSGSVPETPKSGVSKTGEPQSKMGRNNRSSNNSNSRPQFD